MAQESVSQSASQSAAIRGISWCAVANTLEVWSHEEVCSVVRCLSSKHVAQWWRNASAGGQQMVQRVRSFSSGHPRWRSHLSDILRTQHNPRHWFRKPDQVIIWDLFAELASIKGNVHRIVHEDLGCKKPICTATKFLNCYQDGGKKTHQMCL